MQRIFNRIGINGQSFLKEHNACKLRFGDGADTTAAVARGLVGVYWGVQAIPKKWKESLDRQTDICTLAKQGLAKIRNCRKS